VTELKDGSSWQWKLFYDRTLPVMGFWCGLKEFVLLQTSAKQHFCCASSTAASERNFSTHAFIDSKLRNRLDRKAGSFIFNAKNMNEDEVKGNTHPEGFLLVMKKKLNKTFYYR
jgi:hypothetical protein